MKRPGITGADAALLKAVMARDDVDEPSKPEPKPLSPWQQQLEDVKKKILTRDKK